MKRVELEYSRIILCVLLILSFGACASLTTTISKPTPDIRRSTTTQKVVGAQFEAKRQPTEKDPLLEVAVSQQVADEDRFQRRYMLKRTLKPGPRLLLWAGGAAAVYLGYQQYQEGLVVLGETMMGAGAAVPLGTEILVGSQPGSERWEWETTTSPPRPVPVVNIPLEISISDETRRQRTDAFGVLRLDISEYADDVPPGQPMNIDIVSVDNTTDSASFTIPEEIINIHRTIDVEKNIPIGRDRRNDAVALIIANRNYQSNDVPKVKFAHRDGEIMRQYLLNTLGYREGNILIYKDATLGNIRTAVAALRNISRTTSDIFVYYVGHGAPDPEGKRGYFVPTDCDPNFVKEGGIPLDEFYQELSAIDARNITVVVDACFSGTSHEGMIIRNISPIYLEVGTEARLGDNAVAFTSASGDEVSSWYPDKNHSLYSYYFFKGLQGGADANRDKILTVGELKEYLEENVPYMSRRLNNRRQTPSVTPGREGLVIVRYR